jgi:hypothetical protein
MRNLCRVVMVPFIAGQSTSESAEVRYKMEDKINYVIKNGTIINDSPAVWAGKHAGYFTRAGLYSVFLIVVVVVVFVTGAVVVFL